MKTELPTRWWHMLIGFAVMIALILLWSAGFNWVPNLLRGGVIERVLNWLSNAAFWSILVGLVIAFIIRCIVSAKVTRSPKPQPRKRSLIEFPEAFRAFRYQVRDARDQPLGELSLAEVQQRLDSGTLTDDSKVYHPDKQEWLTLEALSVYIHHQQQDYRLHHETFPVKDGGVVHGEFTLDEICLRLNRGSFSRNILIQDEEHGWCTIEQMGIEFEPQPSQPAQSWAG